MSEARREKAEQLHRLLVTEGDSIAENTRLFNRGRYDATADLADYDALKDEARAIKEDAIERLPELIEELRGSVEANGGTLYVADDAADANRYVREVVTARGDSVVKGKSMTTEELELNEALADAGVDVTETDLGEWVLQVADEAPSHLLGPALHKSSEAIADLFNEQFDPAEPLETPRELTKFARDQLLADIEGADVGITGANFVTADSGTVALVTSEGNARKCALVPDTHVAVTGIEKVIPAVEDLVPFLELIGKSATGQDVPSYYSLLTPPLTSPPVDFDRPDEAVTGDPADRDGERVPSRQDDREFHLVLVDNGRSAMREDPDPKETLYCIRCGACANSYGNFQSVGGHAFGGETYTGGIATGWGTGVEGLDSTAGFNDLCTGCTRCVPACPVKIDVPWINAAVRDRVNHMDGDGEGKFDFLMEGLTPDEEPSELDPAKRLFGNFETLAKWGSATAPLSNRVAGSAPARRAMERWLGVSSERELPEFERGTLVDWFEKRGSRVDAADAEREAVLYPDVYTNHVAVERGKAAVHALEALGVRVLVPRSAAVGSGRAPLSQGMVSTARRQAERFRDALLPELDRGGDVVVVEPSDLAAVRREYEKLLPADDYERLSGSCYEVLEYDFGMLENGADGDVLRAGDGEAVDYHAHCQQRTLGLETPTVAVLERLGYEVRTSDTECCGMAGSFGYKSEYYELSMDVGEPLREQFGDDDRRVLASEISCVDQLEALLSRPATHLVELVAPDRSPR